MSDPVISIRNALEAALAAITPAIDIVHENEEYTPTVGRPYCEAYLLWATPGNPTLGQGYYQELGVLQVSLKYPLMAGTLDAATQAGLIRNLFKRGAAFTSGGVKVQIDKTAAVGAGAPDTGTWKVVIRCSFSAGIFT